VKRHYAWFAGFAGGAALYRAFRRRPEPAADPAAELKAKLADARSAGEAAAPRDEPVETPRAATPETGVDDRRSAVHAQGRAASDEMRSE